MACLRKKGNKYYIKDYIDRKEKWIKTGTGDQRIAEAKLKKYELDKLDGLSPFPTKTPLQDVLSGFCKYLRGVSRSENYTKDLSRLRIIFGPACADLGGPVDDADTDALPDDGLGIRVKYLEDITTCKVTDFLDDLVEERALSPKTVNNYREMLLRFVNWAISQKGKRFPGGINPVDAVAVREVKPVPISYLSMKEIRQQLEALAKLPVLQAMVAILIYAGLRREELLWLRTCDIVKCGESFRILVRAKIVDGVYWRPKNKKDRYVPVSPTLLPYLERLLPKDSEDRWLFATPTGQRWDRDNFSTMLRDANQEAARKQAEEGQAPMPIWSCLDFRHTFGTMLASRGVSLYIVAEWMGNSPDVCRKHYAALVEEMTDKYADFTNPPGVVAANSSSCEVEPNQPTAPANHPDSSPVGSPGKVIRTRPALRLVVNR
ncbi:tyrosine-type recombinase/integrase [Geomesophilobacter sediminis]|uniref:Site-specific integrase n=1 Tax=Geomesophilobacter sediminis TaxID=2798584 RepID=A0A8J7JL15_9BACT|nr:site-specific integrase [Geomesophilobacter sediminis]MBJ6724400.1 site-specific integrase [Geomesophilobacter sediminis]